MKKHLLTIVCALMALAIVAAIVVGVFLDRIVKKGIEIYGPRLTQVPVTVDAVHLSLLTGSASVKGLVVGNPPGFKTPQAIAIGTAAVGVNPLTVFSQKIVIRSIRLESPQITFEGGLMGGNNLSKILDNLNSTGKSPGPVSTNAVAQPKSEQKYEVDDLMISGAKVQVCLTDLKGQEVTLPLPTIHLTGMGEGDQGITAADLTRSVMSAITSATYKTVAGEATQLGKSANTLRQAGQKAGSQIGNAIGNLFQK